MPCMCAPVLPHSTSGPSHHHHHTAHHNYNRHNRHNRPTATTATTATTTTLMGCARTHRPHSLPPGNVLHGKLHDQADDDVQLRRRLSCLHDDEDHDFSRFLLAMKTMRSVVAVLTTVMAMMMTMLLMCNRSRVAANTQAVGDSGMWCPAIFCQVQSRLGLEASRHHGLQCC